MTNAVYQNSVQPFNGSYTRKNQFGSWTYATSGTPAVTYRAGVRRPKPKYIDDTPYELRLVRPVSQVRGVWNEATNTDNPQRYEGLYGINLATDSQITANLRHEMNWYTPRPGFDTLAHLKAMSKLNRMDVDVGAAFAEAGKTAQLLGDVGFFTARFVKAAARRDGRALVDLLNSSTDSIASGRKGRLPGAIEGVGRNTVDTYLAYHYGVKPLLNDVNGAVLATTRLPPEEWRVRSKGVYQDVTKMDRLIDHGTRTRCVASRVDSVSCVIWATRRQISLEQDIAWALGLDNPLGSAYEIMPLSSVLDWALPIGDWLEGINALKYYTNWRISSTSYVKEDIAIVPSSGRNGYRNESSYDNQLKGSCSTLAIKRTVLSQPLIPGLVFKNPISLDHAAKGLALLASAAARGGDVPRFVRY